MQRRPRSERSIGHSAQSDQILSEFTISMLPWSSSHIKALWSRLWHVPLYLLLPVSWWRLRYLRSLGQSLASTRNRLGYNFLGLSWGKCWYFFNDVPLLTVLMKFCHRWADWRPAFRLLHESSHEKYWEDSTSRVSYLVILHWLLIRHNWIYHLWRPVAEHSKPTLECHPAYWRGICGFWKSSYHKPRSLHVSQETSYWIEYALTAIDAIDSHHEHAASIGVFFNFVRSIWGFVSFQRPHISREASWHS